MQNSHGLQRKAKLKTAGNRPKNSGIKNEFAFWVQSRRAEITPPPTEQAVSSYQEWMYRRTEECEAEYQQWLVEGRPDLNYVYGRHMDGFGNPIRIFYANLLRIGVRLRVKDGQLRVTGAIEKLSPAYQDEIIKRKSHLIEMLDVVPPEELKPYFFRLISVEELKDTLHIAKRLGVELSSLPVNGGWLIELAESTKRKEAA